MENPNIYNTAGLTRHAIENGIIECSVQAKTKRQAKEPSRRICLISLAVAHLLHRREEIRLPLSTQWRDEPRGGFHPIA